MSERIPAEIKIGGPIKRGLIAALCAAITVEDVGLDWDEYTFRPKSEADFFEAMKDESFLILRDDASRHGEFRGLERFLRKNGVAFNRQSDAKGEHDGEILFSRPEGDISLNITKAGEALVRLADVNNICDLLREQNYDAALKAAEKVTQTASPLLPLEFVD